MKKLEFLELNYFSNSFYIKFQVDKSMYFGIQTTGCSYLSYIFIFLKIQLYRYRQNKILDLEYK